MFCSNCGSQINNGEAFCKECGSRVVANVAATVPSAINAANTPVSAPAKSKKNSTTIIIITVAVVLGMLILIFMGSIAITSFRRSRYINMVRNAHPSSYPRITYGEALNDFLSHPRWSYISTKRHDIVQVEGDCMYDGDRAHVVIQFDVDEDAGRFEAYAMEIDGEPQNILVIAVFLDKVFDSY